MHPRTIPWNCNYVEFIWWWSTNKKIARWFPSLGIAMKSTESSNRFLERAPLPALTPGQSTSSVRLGQCFDVVVVVVVVVVVAVRFRGIEREIGTATPEGQSLSADLHLASAMLRIPLPIRHFSRLVFVFFRVDLVFFTGFSQWQLVLLGFTEFYRTVQGFYRICGEFFSSSITDSILFQVCFEFPTVDLVRFSFLWWFVACNIWNRFDVLQKRRKNSSDAVGKPRLTAVIQFDFVWFHWNGIFLTF